MAYRKITADKVFDGFHWLQEKNVLIVEETGVIRDIVAKEAAGDNVEKLNGILTPGLINCHCHIELSHLKGVIPPHTGLIDFLLTVVKSRAVAEETILERIAAAEKEMHQNGIVCIADVCNTPHALATKSQSTLYWHNLIEVINLYDQNLDKQLSFYGAVLQQYQKLDNGRNISILTPHAPYTVSRATYKAINDATAHAVISIHNQESRAENELFIKGEGDFLKLYGGLGIEQPPITASGKTSLQTYLPYFTHSQTLLLVHNTFITEEDIVFAKEYTEANTIKIVYCLCPNANLYIENTLPPVDLLIKHQCNMVLGTDSYSSNFQLSIASEVKTLLDHFPQLPLATALQWATSNGAAALGHNELGSFEKGKSPGLVLWETDNDSQQLITGRSQRVL